MSFDTCRIFSFDLFGHKFFLTSIEMRLSPFVVSLAQCPFSRRRAPVCRKVIASFVGPERLFGTRADRKAENMKWTKFAAMRKEKQGNTPHSLSGDEIDKSLERLRNRISRTDMKKGTRAVPAYKRQLDETTSFYVKSTKLVISTEEFYVTQVLNVFADDITSVNDINRSNFPVLFEFFPNVRQVLRDDQNFDVLEFWDRVGLLVSSINHLNKAVALACELSKLQLLKFSLFSLEQQNLQLRPESHPGRIIGKIRSFKNSYTDWIMTAPFEEVFQVFIYALKFGRLARTEKNFPDFRQRMLNELNSGDNDIDKMLRCLFLISQLNGSHHIDDALGIQVEDWWRQHNDMMDSAQNAVLAACLFRDRRVLQRQHRSYSILCNTVVQLLPQIVYSGTHQNDASTSVDSSLRSDDDKNEDFAGIKDIFMELGSRVHLDDQGQLSAHTIYSMSVGYCLKLMADTQRWTYMDPPEQTVRSLANGIVNVLKLLDAKQLPLTKYVDAHVWSRLAQVYLTTRRSSPTVYDIFARVLNESYNHMSSKQIAIMLRVLVTSDYEVDLVQFLSNISKLKFDYIRSDQTFYLYLITESLAAIGYYPEALVKHVMSHDTQALMMDYMSGFDGTFDLLSLLDMSIAMYLPKYDGPRISAESLDALEKAGVFRLSEPISYQKAKIRHRLFSEEKRRFTERLESSDPSVKQYIHDEFDRCGLTDTDVHYAQLLPQLTPVRDYFVWFDAATCKPITPQIPTDRWVDNIDKWRVPDGVVGIAVSALKRADYTDFRSNRLSRFAKRRFKVYDHLGYRLCVVTRGGSYDRVLQSKRDRKRKLDFNDRFSFSNAMSLSTYRYDDVKRELLNTSDLMKNVHVNDNMLDRMGATKTGARSSRDLLNQLIDVENV